MKIILGLIKFASNRIDFFVEGPPHRMPPHNILLSRNFGQKEERQTDAAD